MGRTRCLLVSWKPCTLNGPPGCELIGKGRIIAQIIAGFAKCAIANARIDIAIFHHSHNQGRYHQASCGVLLENQLAYSAGVSTQTEGVAGSSGAFTVIAHNLRFGWFGKFGIIIGVFDMAALGQIHKALAIENNISDRMIAV